MKWQTSAQERQQFAPWTGTWRGIASSLIDKNISNKRKTDRQDIKAWGIVFAAVERALLLVVSTETRRLLLRCRVLVAHLAGRTPLGVANVSDQPAAPAVDSDAKRGTADSSSD